MAEKEWKTPPRPSEPPADGFTWVYDDQGGWREVPMEIRMPNEKPFFPKDTPPLDLPVDVNPPGPQSPN
ncbi:MAG: hypothetical protein ACD_40C00194G0001 [uncultured bacterium]|nr:MAG: hypothetical protein ACD_40C00194G0001 [uncultured bacterium]